MQFEAIQAIAWSLFGYKELKLITKLLFATPDPDTKYELPKFGHAQNS